MIKILSKMKQPSVLLVLLLLFSVGTAFADTATATGHSYEMAFFIGMGMAIGFFVIGVIIFASTDQIIFFFGCALVSAIFIIFPPFYPIIVLVSLSILGCLLIYFYNKIIKRNRNRVLNEQIGDVKRIIDLATSNPNGMILDSERPSLVSLVEDVQTALQKSSEEAVREAIEDMTSLRRKITLMSKKENFNDPKAEVV